MNFFELAKNRYSVRDFDTRIPEGEVLDEIVSTALLSPTARNFQPQRIFIAKSKESLEKLASVCRFTFGAPAVLLMGYDKTKAWRSRFTEGADSGETDTALAAAHIMLAACEKGLGTCYVAYFDPEEVKKVLSLPKELEVTALIPIGYPSENASPMSLHFESIEKSEMIHEI